MRTRACVICGQRAIPPGNLCPTCTQQSAQVAFTNQTPCQQCGLPLDNTGTICNACIARTLLPRPILIGKATPVSATPTDVIYVEYTAKVYVGIDIAGGVQQVVWANDQKPEPTGNLLAYDATKRKGEGAYVSAGTPEPPPKFSSVEEAEEWLEANAGKSAYDVEISAERAQQVHEAAAQITISDWL